MNERDIVGKSEEILVSICCITYNQEEYIKDAIEGFLIQKTNFKYEIIIYDDASTDNTPNIIREYERKCPDIIKPIYQTENQHSKGKQTIIFTFEKANGKYIAICEGDDYWIDENKLQKQVDYMENNPKCTFCFHNAKEFFMKSNKMVTYINKNSNYGKYLKSDNIYAPDEIMQIGFVGRIPTASFMFKKEHIKELPDWFYTSICGDMPLKLIMSSYGYGYYIDEEMCVYRRETGKSVTDDWNMQNENTEAKIKHINRFLEILNNFNEFSNYIYSDGINKIKKYYEMEIAISTEGDKALHNKEIAKYYKEMYDDNYLVKYYIKNKLPSIYKIVKKFKNRRKNEKN